MTIDGNTAARWRLRRLGYYLLLIAIFAPLALYVGPNLIVFGMWRRLSAADLGRLTPRYAPLVQAMKEYSRDYGSLPDTDAGLVPRYLPKRVEMNVIYSNQSVDQLMWYPFINLQTISYQFSAPEGWYAEGPYVNGPLPVPPVMIEPTTRP